LIVALLFLGPDKLPDAAKKISKGIRDLKKQSRVLQQTIEDDEHIGGAIRDLKSALRGEDSPVRPKPIKALKPMAVDAAVATAATAALPEPAADAKQDEPHALEAGGVPAPEKMAETVASPEAFTEAQQAAETAHAKATISLPEHAGEPDEDAPRPSHDDAAELAALVKPAANTIARSAPAPVAKVEAAPAPVAKAEAAPAPAAVKAEEAPAAATAETSETSEPKHG
jgi:Sec-independent protein translocase protein TatA